jgi:hypothetical protein
VLLTDERGLLMIGLEPALNGLSHRALAIWATSAGEPARGIEPRCARLRRECLTMRRCRQWWPRREYRRCELNAVTSRYKREAVIPDGRRHEGPGCSGEVRTRDHLRMKELHYRRAPLHSWGDGGDSNPLISGTTTRRIDHFCFRHSASRGTRTPALLGVNQLLCR